MDNNKNDLDMKTSHDIQTTLVGIFIVLLGILGLINATSISGILNFTFAVFLGNFYYIGFFFVIFAGFVNIFRRQPLVIRLNLPTIGFLLLVIAVLATSTSITLRALDPPVILTLDNFFDIYKSYFPMMTEIPTTYPSEVGGGIIGYVVVGLFYSILGESGITLGLVITFILGFFFSFEFLWKKLYKLWKKQRLVQMNEKSEFDRIRQTPVKRNPTEVELSRSSDYYPQPVSNTPSPRATLIQGPNRPISENLSSGGLVKARFNNQNNLQSSDKPTINTPISSSTVIKPTPTKLTSGHSTLTKATITIPKITEEIIAEQYSSTSKINVSKDIDSSLNNYQKETITETQTPIYVKPSIDLLEVRETGDQYIFNNKEAEKRLLMINQTFNDLKVNASAIGFQVGPSVTSFDVMLAKTELINSVKMIIPNLSIRLGGLPALLEEIVPGKDISSLQVPNSKVAIVGFREIIDLINSNSNLDGKVIIPFGKTTSGQLSYLNLKEVIHMLVAGTTGSGKTVFMHTLITTILMRHSPEEIRLLIIDPKFVEMSRYSNLPHLLAPIITECDEAKVAFMRLINVMQERYRLFGSVSATDIDSYNQYARKNSQPILPLLVIIVDEYADLVESAPQISEHVERLAAKCRAAGMHLIIATQRPTVKVVTGNIKNNIITKIALLMNMQVDSMTVLGHAGAEKLLGNGDMLVSNPRLSRFSEVRVQGAFISNEELDRVVGDIKTRMSPSYDPEFLNLVDRTSAGPSFGGNILGQEDDDSLYPAIKEMAMSKEYFSISFITREYNMAYPRAKNLFTRLQNEGIVAMTPESPQSNKGCRVIIRTQSEEK